NVFLGDMSIVGPRPHAIEFNESYRDMVSIIKLRNRAKPGITGWAQIHGYRGDVDDPELQKKRTEKRIEYDIWYIENWSLWLDIEIVFETIIQTITGRNKGT
ncbi:MAG: undecaprenyl-phosphate glucose phosphotransferase, partial [Ignavibacteria bacterium]